MKRVPWIIVVIAALLVGAVFLLRGKPERRSVTDDPAPGTSSESSVGAFRPDAVNVGVALPKPTVVDIQDGKTIDFSSGLPIIKDSGKDQAVLERALKEMEEAAAGVSFGSPGTKTK